MRKRAAGRNEPNRPLKQRTHKRFSGNGTMVIFFPVILKDLFILGRNYPWPRPDSCPRCCSYRLWGHGYVPAYFEGYDRSFSLKRYLCPDCGCVIRLRPRGYFKRFQASIAVIRSSIAIKSHAGKWRPGIKKERQRHWFRSLCKRIKVYLTDEWHRGILAGFDHLLALGQIPVSRAI